MKPEDPAKEAGQAAREALLAERRSRLSPAQQALLARRLSLRSPEGPPASSSLVAIQPAGSRPPFFCVHPAGGDVLGFQGLSRHLGMDQPFYGLQSRGLMAGEEPLESIEEMAAAYRAELARVTAGPYYLGGWSLGGSVAYEMARQLEAAGKRVALLALLDATPGPWPPAEPAGTDADEENAEEDDTPWLMDIALYVERLWNVELGLAPDTLRVLSPEARRRRFLAALANTPLAGMAGGEALERLLRVFRTNVRAFRRFRPGPAATPITLFRPAAEIDAADPLLGWDRLGSAPILLESVPGDHLSLLAEPHVRPLAERLSTYIPGPR